MTTTLVTWSDRFGNVHTTRIVTPHVEAFSADVIADGGELHTVEVEDGS